MTRQERMRAARLYAAAETLRESLKMPLPAAEQGTHKRAIAALHAALGAKPFAAARAAGRAMTLEEAVAYALRAEEDS